MAEVKFTLESNKDLVLEATEEAIHTALEAVGVQAQAQASAQISANGSVNTGRLRASITYAVSGDSGRLHSYSDDQGNHYSDSVPSAGDAKEHTVYIGTNVNYAMYVEFGHSQQKGRFVPGYWKGKRFIYDPEAEGGMVLKATQVDPKPFLRPAIQNNLSQYQQIFEEELSKIGK